MKSPICCIFNYAPHYRKAIYKLLDNEIPCHYYFGNNVRADILKLDYSVFNSPAHELVSVWYFNRVYWIKGSIKLLNQPYKKYLLTGETHCLSTWVMLIMARITNKEIFLWTHGFYGKENCFQSLVKKIFFSMTSGVFLYGDYAKQLMIKRGIIGEKLHVIYNSLDYANMLSVREQIQHTDIYKKKFNNSNPIIIFTGRLEPIKKLDLLLYVTNRLIASGIPLNLVIVGDGSEKANLEYLAEQLDIARCVWFFGSSYDEHIIGELIYNADLCVSPGNVGLTAIHSLSYGTPVVTHHNFPKQMPEFEAIEKGITGDFFDEGNVASLQQVIENWLSVHPLKEKALINACFQRIDSFYNPIYQVRVLKSVLNS